MTLPVITANNSTYFGVVLPSGNINARAKAPSNGGSAAIVPAIGLYTVTNLGTVTIGNTGTIIQHTVTGATIGNGITLEGSSADNPSGAAYGADVTIYGGGAIGAPGSNIFSGSETFSTGIATDGNKTVIPAYLIFNSPGIYSDGTAFGGQFLLSGGSIINADSSDVASSVLLVGGSAGTSGSGGGISLSAGSGAIGGEISLYGGTGTSNSGGGVQLIAGAGASAGGVIAIVTGQSSGGDGGALFLEANVGYSQGGGVRLAAGAGTGASGIGGDIIVQPGYGTTLGHLIINTIGTADPHVLHAVFQSPTANLAGNFPMYRSQG